MSFGFSVGDFILLTQVAHKTFRNCQEAGDEYVEIANAVRCLHSVLRTLRAEVQRPESKIFKQDPASTAQLLETAEGCKNVLDSLDYILAKYEGLKVNSQAGVGKMIWQRFRFGSKVEELVVIRSKLVTYTSALSILIDTLHFQAIDRVETKIDGGFAELNGKFEKMRKEIFTIATQARSEERKRSTMSTLSLSTYAGDEKIVWRDFRRELVKKGFKSKSLEKNKYVLLAYMIKLDQSGLLDRNNVTSDADNPNPWWAEKMFGDTMNSLADLQSTEESPSSDGLPQAIINKLHPKPTVDEGDEVENTDTHGEDGSDQKSGLPSPRPSNPVVSNLREPSPKPASRPNSSFSTRSAQSSPDVTPSRAPSPLPGVKPTPPPVSARKTFSAALTSAPPPSPSPPSSAPVPPAPPPLPASSGQRSPPKRATSPSPPPSAPPPLSRLHTIQPNKSALEPSCYTLSNGGGSFSHSVTGPASAARVSGVGMSKGEMMEIKDSRWRFQDESTLPKPRDFVGGPKRYRAGRGGNVPLDLSLFD